MPNGRVTPPDIAIYIQSSNLFRQKKWDELAVEVAQVFDYRIKPETIRAMARPDSDHTTAIGQLLLPSMPEYQYFHDLFNPWDEKMRQKRGLS